MYVYASVLYGLSVLFTINDLGVFLTINFGQCTVS